MTNVEKAHKSRMVTVDGNEAAASVAHRVSEVIAIYPITPSSPMGEFSDEWSYQGKKNIWGLLPDIMEMQSEGGAAGAVHGALQSGALTTTFTASQGLLLMIPNMYKIAGELNAFCMHVTARTLATHALSIFGDHSDVMACRQTGFALIASASVQEAHDLACISHAATLKARVPFLHFFDGFRTSHEVAKIDVLTDDDLLFMMDGDMIRAHRERALSPDHPLLRGTAQNPDTFFQAREACEPYYRKTPEIVQETMDRFAARIGRRYHLFDYVGHPEAERVIVIMASGAETAEETAEWLKAKGEKVGVLKIRLFRPFSIKHFLQALPKTVKKLAVLDRTKEPGAIGDPLYLDVIAALREARDEGFSPWATDPRVVAGRYGLSSKEFTPSMVKSIFDELSKEKPKNHFTIGIVDDINLSSLPYDPEFDIEGKDVVKSIFYGLGADGTVGANKNSIKIIGEGTPNYAQGYFVYDSKKSGAITVSHVRFGPKPIRSPYLIRKASFVACHQFNFVEKYDVLGLADRGATFLLNAPYSADEVWGQLTREVQEDIIKKAMKFYVIDAYKVAKETDSGRRINTIMQTCFFAISGILPREEAIAKIKETIKKTYGKKGDEVVRRNFAAVDQTLAGLFEVKVPGQVSSNKHRPPTVAEESPDFVKRVSARMLAGEGDLLPVSAFPPDGTWPTGTAKWEKRNIALEIPVWDASICIQCNKCAFVCPHAAIRANVYSPEFLSGAPSTFKSMDYKAPEFKGWKYTIQVAPEDCTGCNLCVMVCPAKDKANPSHKAINMTLQEPLREAERENFGFFLSLPQPDRTKIKSDVKGSQFLEPLFEFSGACSGCGETPYVKLFTQLYGDRAMIANATGCSSIYGGNLPTTPYTTNKDGRGPAWSNSLFEDTAEFGLGFRLAVDQLAAMARGLVGKLAAHLPGTLVEDLLKANQSQGLASPPPPAKPSEPPPQRPFGAGSDEAVIAAQRERVLALRKALKTINDPDARRLESVVDYLVKKSVWIVGGDGWAYDIGYGGLDHVLSTNRDVNILVLDTEVYSNTGGQQSKATPRGAVAKFAMGGKMSGKKDLGLMAMTYGTAYVARIAFGAKDAQTVQVFKEADAFPGPSLIIAYSPCIAHGYDLAFGNEQQKLLVDSGIWPLYRFDPRRVEQGLPPLLLESAPPKAKASEFRHNETRFRMVEKMDPKRFRSISEEAQRDATQRYAIYQQLAGITVPRSSASELPVKPDVKK